MAPLREGIGPGFPELHTDPKTLILRIKRGLPAERIDKLAILLDMPIGEVLNLVGIATSTLSRRRQRGRLTKAESDRVYRIAHLVHRAAVVFGSLDDAREWLKKPQYALGGATPLDFADTEPGAREVEDLLGRIEHGIPV